MRKPDGKLFNPDSRTTTVSVKLSKRELARLDRMVKEIKTTRTNIIRMALSNFGAKDE